jgi:hypothetical protein
MAYNPRLHTQADAFQMGEDIGHEPRTTQELA